MASPAPLSTTPVMQVKTCTNGRTRRWHSKTRSGCMRCRIRHIKCDEQQPECARCLKSGLKCGYDAVVAKIFSIDDTMKFDESGDRRFYDYFVNGAGQLLATYQAPLAKFWSQLAPQMSRTYPALQYAFTALGAIQEPVHSGPPNVMLRRPKMAPTALKYFVRSISNVRTAESAELSSEAALACVLSFIAISIWTDRTSMPILHIEGGLQMLRDYRKKTEQDPTQGSKAMIAMYTHAFDKLAIAACAFSDDYPGELSSISRSYALAMELESAAYLLNFVDAFNSIDTLLQCIFRLNLGHTSSCIDEKVSSALNQFILSLNELHIRDVDAAVQRGQPKSANTFDLSELKIHHRAARIMFDAYVSGSEMSYDLFESDFRFIVDESRQHGLQLQNERCEHGSKLRTTLGLIPPLFLVATKCRHPIIRREALEVLHSLKCAEREWTSCIATNIARYVIESEEQTAQITPTAIVPLSARIQLERVKHSTSECLTYLQYRYCSGNPSIPSIGTTLPFRGHPLIELDGACEQMSAKKLRAFGYTGIIFFTPPLSCHCPTTSDSSLWQIESETVLPDRDSVGSYIKSEFGSPSSTTLSSHTTDFLTNSCELLQEA